MKIVEVIPIKKGLPQETLTYFSSEEIAEGTLVSIPIRSKLIDAIVVGTKDAREEKAAIKSGSITLRKIAKIKSEQPIPSYIFETATLAAQYYKQTRGSMMKLIVPDYSCFGFLSKKSKNEDKNIEDEKIQPERLIFQAPLEERISFYKTYIRESFARKESVSIICPTISDCELFFEHLSKGISDFVIILNSDLSEKKYSELIKKIAEEEHPIVFISTPSFAALQRKDVKTIILEHENSSAYNTPTFPSFDFRIIIEILARTSSKKFIMADSLLRVETLGRYENKELGTLAPVTFRSLTPVEINVIPYGLPETLPTRLRNEQIAALSEQVRLLMGAVKQKKLHVFAFTLRTGLATITKCRDCGSVLLCEYCHSALVLYQNSAERKIFICNKCKRHKPSESKCGKCGSWNLSAHGLGTEFVEEEIKREFPDVPVFRIDRETAPTRAAARKIAAQFSAQEFAVLVGTEMALFYLKEMVSYSAVISFDTLFNIPSYRINERIIGTLLSIAEHTRNKLYVQTRNPHEPIIDLIRSNNYMHWYKSELAEREEYNYPPFSTILKITWSGKESEKEAIRDALNELLKNYKPDIFDSEIIRKGKKEPAINAIIRPKKDEWSLQVLLSSQGLSAELVEILNKLPAGSTLSVNPENLL